MKVMFFKVIFDVEYNIALRWLALSVWPLPSIVISLVIARVPLLSVRI